MKNLQEKFDQLPQDFDQMAIWQGVDTSRRSGFRRIFLWALLVGMGIAGLLFGLGQTEGFGGTEGKPAPLFASAQSLQTKPEDGACKEEIPPPVESVVFTASLPPVKEIDILTYRVETGEDQAAEKDVNSRFQPTTLSRIEPVFALLSPCSIPSQPITRFTVLAEENLSDLPSLPQPEPLHRSHSLSLQAGLGMHRTAFSTLAEGNTELRATFERPKLDYSLALRYEKETPKHLLFSLSARYDLFRDHIDTEFLRDSMGQRSRVEYDLHNHYHLFSAQMMVGKRFHQKRLFWDVMGGTGITLAQVSETDFFIADDKLASEAYLEQIYSHSISIYPTAQLALGKQLGEHMFIRLGTHTHAGLSLTSGQSPMRHRLISLNGFVEVGGRF